MKLTACGKTDIGLLRSNNEDCCFVDTQLGLFIVADGMGGHLAGEIASAMAVKVVREQLTPLLAGKRQVPALLPDLSKAVQLANQTIFQAASDNRDWRGMGTTLTILLLQSGQALVAHIGDSRLYRWRPGHLEQLSEDHSLVADQLRRGLISPAEAESSNQRNVLLQAVGTTPSPEIWLKQLAVKNGDTFLLCSDGLTDMLSDEKISELLSRNTPPEQGCDQLIEQAKAAGGKDNITAVLVQVEEL